jgi:hypothetical protein
MLALLPLPLLFPLLPPPAPLLVLVPQAARPRAETAQMMNAKERIFILINPPR